jgi:hypothetical protein
MIAGVNSKREDVGSGMIEMTGGHDVTYVICVVVLTCYGRQVDVVT